MYKIPLSNGELIDKYTILLIKNNKITDETKLNYINKELTLFQIYVNELNKKYDLENLINDLKNINLKLWEIEDNIRIKEKENCFDETFIQLARSVYITNDERATVKNKINNITNSDIKEIKSYEKY